MKLFADTADISEIRELAATCLLDGVTTSPLLIAKTGRAFKEVIREICEVVEGPVSAEVTATDFEGMVAEGIEAVRNVRRRYDGERRNAWNEAECGNHYARAMASWTPLVAMISVPICARVDPLDPIGSPSCRGRSGDLHRPSPSTLSGSACPSRRCRDIDRATDATNPVSQLSCAGIIVVPTTGREKNPGRGGCPF